MFRRIAVLAVALSMGALTGACTGSVQPSPTPTPSPTFACIPEAGGDPVPCGPIEYEQAQKRDKLYAEAEAVYRRYWAELGRLSRETHPEWSAEMSALVAGPFEERARQALSSDQRRREVSGDSVTQWVRRLPGLVRSGSIVALLTCTDATGAVYEGPGGVRGPGRRFEQRIYLGPGSDQNLRIVDSESREVDSCAD